MEAANNYWIQHRTLKLARQNVLCLLTFE